MLIILIVCILIILMFIGGLYEATCDRFIEYYNDDGGPKVIRKSSNCKGFGKICLEYTVEAKEYRIVCSGYCYNNKDDAIENPLHILSYEYKIGITILSTYGVDLETFTMVSGEYKLIEYLGYYLYVIID